MSEATARERLVRNFFTLVPHNVALGLSIEGLDADTAVMRLPYRAEIIGNPDTGVIHGGAVTALMDACCGAAVFMSLEPPQPVATLDLRIDYLRPGVVGADVIADAHCYAVTRSVAFVRCTARHDDGTEIATAAGTFMIGTPTSRND